MIVELLGGIGVTFIVVESKLLTPAKATIKQEWLRYLLSCHQCSGFWVGCLSGILVGCPIAEIPLHGGAVSILSVVVAGILDKLQK